MALGGIITPTPSLSRVLKKGHTLDDGQFFKSANGGGYLSLRDGANNSIALTTDNNAGGEGYFFMEPGYTELSNYTADGQTYLSTTLGSFSIQDAGGSNTTTLQAGGTSGKFHVLAGTEIDFSFGGLVGLHIESTNGVSWSASWTESVATSFGVSINSNSVTFGQDTKRSVVLGGDEIKALSDDTAYVKNLGFYHLDGATDREGVLTNASLTASRTWTLADNDFVISGSDRSSGNNVLQVSKSDGSFGACADSGSVGVGWDSASNALQPLGNNNTSLGTSARRWAVVYGRVFRATEGLTSVAGYSFTQSGDATFSTIGSGGGLSFKAGDVRFKISSQGTGTEGIALIGYGLASGDSAHVSALLDLRGDKGLLLPRLTTIERNALSSVNGLTVFNTDTSQFEGHNGTSWIILG